MGMLRSIGRALGRLVARGGVRGERGATAIEYAMVAAFIAGIIVAAVAVLGAGTQANFECSRDAIQTLTEAC